MTFHTEQHRPDIITRTWKMLSDSSRAFELTRRLYQSMKLSDNSDSSRLFFNPALIPFSVEMCVFFFWRGVQFCRIFFRPRGGECKPTAVLPAGPLPFTSTSSTHETAFCPHCWLRSVRASGGVNALRSVISPSTTFSLSLSASLPHNNPLPHLPVL